MSFIAFSCGALLSLRFASPLCAGRESLRITCRSLALLTESEPAVKGTWIIQDCIEEAFDSLLPSLLEIHQNNCRGLWLWEEQVVSLLCLQPL